MSKKSNLVEGPRGLKMPEALARRIEDVAKSAGVKADDYRRRAATPTDFRLEDGSRSDVSTVTTDAIDHDREVVLPKGINLTVFRENPVVPFAHQYDELPVGKCDWIKSAANGMIAKTTYASRPKTYGSDVAWLPDAILSMMQQDMCKGKSIGFIPTSIRDPSKDEIAARPELSKARGIIDGATLLEYSVAPVPANPDAIAIAVSKCMGDARLKSLIEETAEKTPADMQAEGDAPMPACPKCMKSENVGRNRGSGPAYVCSTCLHSFDAPEKPAKAVEVPEVPEIIVPFVTAKTIARARELGIANLKAAALPLIKQAIRDEYDRLCGRV